MKKSKLYKSFMALALSIILVVGLAPLTTSAEGPEIVRLDIRTAHWITPYWWYDQGDAIRDEPVNISVRAIYSDGSERRVSSNELDFYISGVEQ